MPVYGDLDTMPLTDVLQWIGVAQKTGVLEIDRGGLRRRIEFNKGYVCACHADDPAAQLGPLLVARGMISEALLDQALVRQELGGKRLGFILVELGALTESDVRRMITAHIEQTIQRLFNWEGAVFRFYEGAGFDPVRVEVGLTINDLLLRTLQHQDELGRIRQDFASSGCVLSPTAMPVPEDLSTSEMSRKIFESIDGRRTIGEVVIAARASEILVLKLLHRLLTMKLVEVAETRAVPPGTATLLDPPGAADVPHGTNFELQRLGGRPEGLGGPVPAAVIAPVDAELLAARQLFERAEYAVALELLAATSRTCPGDRRVGELRAEIEVLRTGADAGTRLPLSHIPVCAEAAADETLDPEETFLLSLIDGASDVRSIVSLAALREAEVLGMLELLVKKGRICLREPALL